MKFKCRCGNVEDGFTFKQFKGYKKCRECSGIVYYNLKVIRNIFNENGCELLTDYYTDNQQLVKYKCKCGYVDEVKIHNYIHSKLKRCRSCTYEYIGSKTSLSFDEVKRYFSDNGCVLLSNEYINNSTPLKYICNCGNQAETIFNSFQYGHRCSQCLSEKISSRLRRDVNDDM